MAGSHQYFEDLGGWKRSSRLAVEVLKTMDVLKHYALKDWMARSCISIPFNLAEGAERGAEQEFARFLSIPKGSAVELGTQSYVAIRAGLIEPNHGSILVHDAKKMGALIEGLKKSLPASGFLASSC